MLDNSIPTCLSGFGQERENFFELCDSIQAR